MVPMALGAQASREQNKPGLKSLLDMLPKPQVQAPPKVFGPEQFGFETPKPLPAGKQGPVVTDAEIKRAGRLPGLEGWKGKVTIEADLPTAGVTVDLDFDSPPSVAQFQEATTEADRKIATQMGKLHNDLALELEGGTTLPFDLFKLQQAVRNKGKFVYLKGGDSMMPIGQAMQKAAKVLRIDNWQAMRDTSSPEYKILRHFSTYGGVTPDSWETNLRDADLSPAERGMLERNPGMAQDNGFDTAMRMAATMASPYETTATLAGDPRSHQERQASTIGGIPEPIYGGLADLASYVLGGELLAPLRAAEVGTPGLARLLGVGAGREVPSAASTIRNAVMLNAGQALPQTFVGARDISSMTGKPYLDALGESLDQTVSGLVGQFSPFSPFDPSMPMQDRVMAVANLGLLALGKGLQKGVDRSNLRAQDRQVAYFEAMRQLSGDLDKADPAVKAPIAETIQHLQTPEGQKDFVTALDQQVMDKGPVKPSLAGPDIEPVVSPEPVAKAAAEPMAKSGGGLRGMLDAIAQGRGQQVDKMPTFNPGDRLDPHSPGGRALDDAWMNHRSAFDPSSPDYDQALHGAFYRHQYGEAPDNAQVLREDFVNRADAHTQEIMNRMREQSNYGELVDYQKDALNGVRDVLAGNTDKGGGKFVRVRRGRNGEWVADARTPTEFVSLGMVSPEVRALIRNFVEDQGDSDHSYVSESAYHEWRSAGRPDNGLAGFKPRTRLEMLDKEGGDRLVVPKNLVKQFASELAARVREQGRIDRESGKAPTGKHLQAAIDFYHGADMVGGVKRKSMGNVKLGGEPRIDGKKVSTPHDVVSIPEASGTRDYKLQGDSLDALNAAREQMMKEMFAANYARDPETNERTLLAKSLAQVEAGRRYAEAKAEIVKNYASAIPLDEWHASQKDPVRDSRYGTENQVVTKDAYDQILARRKKYGQDGITRLSSGLDPQDLSDYVKIGIYHFEAGLREFAAWSKHVIADFGEAGRPYLDALWRHVQKNSGIVHMAADTADVADRLIGQNVPGNDRPSLVPEGKNKLENFKLRIRQAMFDNTVAAEQAVRLLESASGEKAKALDKTAVDLHMQLSRMTRLNHLVEMSVEYGVVDADGKKIGSSVYDVIDKADALGLDLKDWMEFRAALRRLELEPRKMDGDPAKFGPTIMATFDKRVREYLDRVDPDKVHELNQVWDSLIDAHLLLRERYGLERPGYAEEVRDANPHYWPMYTVGDLGTDVMRVISPQKGASPGDKTVRAKGQQSELVDGLSAMAMMIEKTIREGEKNQAFVPFFEAAQAEPLMEHVVRWATPEEVDSYRENPTTVNVVELRRDGHSIHYMVDPLVWQAMRAYDPVVLSAVQRFLQGMSTAFKAGTTTHNPFFKMVHNPIMDLGSAIINHGLKPGYIWQGFAEARKGYKSDLFRQWVTDLGSLDGQSTRDYEFQKDLFDRGIRNPKLREISGAWSRVQDIGSNFWEKLGEVGGFMESGTRLAMYLQETKSGKSRLAASQAGVDLMNFGRTGDLGKTLSAWGTPYAAIPGQAMLQLWTGFRKNPAKWAARAFFLATLPKLMEQYVYGDDPEYQALPDYQKDRGLLIKIGNQWMLLPFDNALSAPMLAMPRRFMMYAQQKMTLGAAFMGSSLAAADAYVPFPLPVAGKMGAETMIYAGTGGVIDARFGNVKAMFDYSKPGQQLTQKQQERKSENAYRFAKQQVGNLTGTAGRDLTQVAGYFLGYEEKFPNPLARYSPEAREVREATQKRKTGIEYQPPKVEGLKSLEDLLK